MTLIVWGKLPDTSVTGRKAALDLSEAQKEQGTGPRERCEGGANRGQHQIQGLGGDGWLGAGRTGMGDRCGRTGLGTGRKGGGGRPKQNQTYDVPLF